MTTENELNTPTLSVLHRERLDALPYPERKFLNRLDAFVRHHEFCSTLDGADECDCGLWQVWVDYQKDVAVNP